ncbi:RTL6 protein, partial [Amia calva]|nr:RTL6 protein [Amia calva]
MLNQIADSLDKLQQILPLVHPPEAAVNTALAAAATLQPVCLATPDPYDSAPDKCAGFLLQCFLYFSYQPSSYPNDESRIAFIITLLTGRALQWAVAVWAQKGEITQSLTAFLAHFKEVFNHPAEGRDAEMKENLTLSLLPHLAVLIYHPPGRLQHPPLQPFPLCRTSSSPSLL